VLLYFPREKYRWIGWARETWETGTRGGILCGANDESYRELQRPIETGVIIIIIIIIIIIMSPRECAQLEQSCRCNKLA